MKDNQQILVICIVLGMTIGMVFEIIFGGEGGKGIGIGIWLGTAFGSVISAMIINFKANGSEQTEEDGELMTDEEEKQVWEEFQGKVEDDEDDIP